MTLEQQVANLVNSTTQLTGTVNSELDKVRQENTNFKNSLTDTQGQGIFNNVKIGRGTGDGSQNLAVGNSIFGNNFVPVNNLGQGSVGVGVSCLLSLTTGFGNVGIGTNCGNGITNGNNNVIVGTNTGIQFDGGLNTIVGAHNLLTATYFRYGVAIGFGSQQNSLSSEGNTSIGANSLRNNQTGSENTALGRNALFSSSQINNSTGVGARAEVTGSNQVQLGDSSTTTYVFGTVQNRSDLRDKADVRNTILGLDFVKSLRPVDYRWDMREDYKSPPPQDPGIDATEQEKARYQSELQIWLEACKLKNITHNGTKKRRRFHHGLIAQEVKQVLDQKGIDFGGYQDHSIGGGDDVLSLGYDQFIAPLIKAVQELAQQNEALVARISALESK